MDLLEYQGKQLFARHGHPGARGPPGHHGATRPSPRPSAIGYPVRGQGPGPDRRPRQGRRHQDRQGPRRRPRPRRRRSSAWTSAASPSTRCGSRRPRHRRRVLRVDRLRPLGQGAAGHALDQGRDGHRGGRRRGPGRDRPPPRRPAARLPGLPRPPAGLRGRRRRRRRAPDRRDARQALRRLRGRGGDARRGQPADRHRRPRRRRPRRQGHARRQRAVPPPGQRRAAQPRAPRTRRSRWPRSAA